MLRKTVRIAFMNAIYGVSEDDLANKGWSIYDQDDRCEGNEGHR